MTTLDHTDATHLKSQQDYVRYAMREGDWFTFGQMASYLRPFFGLVSEGGVAARIRDLRKEGFIVEGRKVKPGGKLNEYRMIPKSNGPQRRLF